MDIVTIILALPFVIAAYVLAGFLIVGLIEFIKDLKKQ